jgi:ATP/maltotriose-dependent transcriptional regulator MalT
LLLAEGGKPDQAAPILEEFGRDGLNTLVQDDLWAITMGFMAEACAIVGNARLAVHLFERLEPASGMALVCGPNAACLGPVDRVLGRLKACTGAHAEACEWFERALTQAREWKSPPTVLRTACDFAESLVADGSPAALRRARELEREVGQDAQLAGMRSIAERFNHVSRNLRDLASARGFDQLTAREVEVLRLLASGASNSEISRKLGISFATVATHVRSILSKTDSRNRTAAANYARQAGLLPVESATNG